MKNLFIVFALLLLSCNNKKNHENIDPIIQDPEEIHAIKTLLKSQQNCWNNGDIDGFMKGYWKSEKLIFTSLNYKPTYGWNNTLKRYKESYPNQESMGELKLKIIDIKLNSKISAILKGKWKIIRKKISLTGYFG